MLERLRQWLSRNGDTHHLPDLPAPVVIRDRLLSQRLIVLDLETTGLNVSRDQVISVGATAIVDNAIPMWDQMDMVLKRPELDISETVLIHGIGPEALRQGHETEDALIHLLEWMEGAPILAYHSAFDQSFLEKLLRKQLGYSYSHTWFDVAEILPALFPEKKGKRLDDWIDHFDLDISARHNAAADAMATAELSLIALRRAQEKDIRTVDQLEQTLRTQRRLRNLHSNHHQ